MNDVHRSTMLANLITVTQSMAPINGLSANRFAKADRFPQLVRSLGGRRSSESGALLQEQKHVFST